GIVGSLGAVFSRITGNHIYRIWSRRLFTGAEMAGIKIHAAIDVLIRNNRIHDAGRGMWMDWMAQGTRISGNLLYNNTSEDLFVEVDHGPFLVDNNLFLSPQSLRDMSEGGAYVHNLMAGLIDCAPEPNRSTPYHGAHSTAIAGMSSVRGGDDRFCNNIFLRPAGPSGALPGEGKEPGWSAGFGLSVYDAREFRLQTGGNVYCNGARPYRGETDALTVPDIDLALAEEGDSVHLHLAPGTLSHKVKIVTTDRLGKARVSGLAYENPDGSPLTIDTDYFGKRRDPAHPTSGPFENPSGSSEGISLKVW
ncbi:MAG TPA: right-handed parallel beta-helix repeat-containing protein, partial [Bacteroidota bacterium]|nr:right-handed parallel beta-helix repeat-containing protein [Bacteroidota bacterium]